MNLLKQLYGIHSPSGNEKRMRKFIRRYIRKNIPQAQCWGDQYGNLYIMKGEAADYPCLVSHLDQVQHPYPKDYRIFETDEIIFAYSASQRSFCGLGADDKNGIWICLRCLEKYPTLKVAFFADEERGCNGSSKADMAFFNDTRFILEPDRRGKRDIITQIGFSTLCSKEFYEAIRPGLYGYKEESGMMTDIEALRKRGYPNSCVNLSCGYYDPHTSHEFTQKKDLLNCLDFVSHIIETIDTAYPCDDVGGYWGDDLWAKDEEFSELLDLLDYDILESPDANPTAADLYAMYKPQFPSLTRSDYEIALRFVMENKGISEDETDCFGIRR